MYTNQQKYIYIYISIYRCVYNYKKSNILITQGRQEDATRAEICIL